MKVRGESKSDTIPLGSSVLFRCDAEMSSLQAAGLAASLLGPSPTYLVSSHAGTDSPGELDSVLLSKTGPG